MRKSQPAHRVANSRPVAPPPRPARFAPPPPQPPQTQPPPPPPLLASAREIAAAPPPAFSAGCRCTCSCPVGSAPPSQPLALLRLTLFPSRQRQVRRQRHQQLKRPRHRALAFQQHNLVPASRYLHFLALHPEHR